MARRIRTSYRAFVALARAAEGGDRRRGWI
jgi:hypothetical protein